jgi:hypothetical protein
MAAVLAVIVEDYSADFSVLPAFYRKEVGNPPLLQAHGGGIDTKTGSSPYFTEYMLIH